MCFIIIVSSSSTEAACSIMDASFAICYRSTCVCYPLLILPNSVLIIYYWCCSVTSYADKSCFNLYLTSENSVERDDSVGIVTRYGLDGLGIKSRCKARCAASVQTGPGAHPVSYTMGTGSLSWGYSGRRVALTTHPHPI
jgi:hypothetical protein